jgi:hypothetical protein
MMRRNSLPSNYNLGYAIFWKQAKCNVGVWEYSLHYSTTPFFTLAAGDI